MGVMGEVAGPSLVGTDTAYGYDRPRTGISRGGPHWGWGSRERLEIVRTEGALAVLAVTTPGMLLQCLLVSLEAPDLCHPPKPCPWLVTPLGKPDERTEKLISKGALVSGWPHLVGG